MNHCSWQPTADGLESGDWMGMELRWNQIKSKSSEKSSMAVVIQTPSALGRVIRCEPVRAIRIGGLYVQKVETIRPARPQPRNIYPHGFVSGSSRPASQGVTHPGIALAAYSLNFGVLMGSEASHVCDPYVPNAIIMYGYAEYGPVQVARKLFDERFERTIFLL
ncbi:hypothetical protein LguiA_007531 [Lonicera macranthoides]